MLGRRESLSSQVVKQLSNKINDGVYKTGERIPTETDLCTEYGVSRTVIREAVASLRADGLLISRQGIGVFVSQARKRPPFEIMPPDVSKVTDILQILELRLGVEVEACGLAAARHTPAQMEEIRARFAEIEQELRDEDGDRGHADFRFHLAITRATNNPYFEKFITFMGPLIIPRNRLASGLHGYREQEQDYHHILQREHLDIVRAIEKRQVEAARQAMHTHLSSGIERYRLLEGSE